MQLPVQELTLSRFACSKTALGCLCTSSPRTATKGSATSSLTPTNRPCSSLSRVARMLASASKLATSTLMPSCTAATWGAATAPASPSVCRHADALVPAWAGGEGRRRGEGGLLQQLWWGGRKVVAAAGGARGERGLLQHLGEKAGGGEKEGCCSSWEGGGGRKRGEGGLLQQLVCVLFTFCA